MADVEYDERYTQYQLQRSWLRKFVRKAYLARAAGQLHGPSLDFGCGVGELLQWLPPGSKGLEYNRATVDYCRAKGLDVTHYDGFVDDWSLSGLTKGDGLQSMVVSHVLEHLDGPGGILRKLLAAAERIGITRVLVIVPGMAGYRSDDTHRTFVDETMIRDNATTPWVPVEAFHFPVPSRAAGDYFLYNELHVRLERNPG